MTRIEEWVTLTRRSLLRDADALRLHLESNMNTVFALAFGMAFYYNRSFVLQCRQKCLCNRK